VKFSIRAKLILVGIIIIIISTGFFGWFTVQHEENALRTELDERGHSLSQNLAMNSEYGVLTMNKDELNRLVNNILQQKDICSASIEDKDGIILAEVGKGTDKTPFKEFSAPIMTEQQTGKIKEEMVLSLEQGQKKEQIGKVRVEVSLVSFRRKINELRRAVIGAIFIALIFLVVGITAAVNIYIDSPIKNLISATQRIARGDLEYTIPIRSKDEIGVLTVFFNKMTGDLKTSRKKIEEYSKILEQKVAERTRALEESVAKLRHITGELQIAKTSLESKVAERTAELEKERAGLDQKVKEKTAELQEKIEDLQVFHDAAVGRELKMIGLEKEIDKLKRPKE
jgi:methyl-accepting chemotaxis protein